jgi:hypothetical protein
MPIKIIRRPAPAEPDGLVDDAPKAEVAYAPKQSIDWWTEHGLPPNAKPRQCAYCKQMYLKPCAEAEHARCQNFEFAEKRRAQRGPQQPD